jgi:ubiquinol-cytochrome c reductase iron-sulfur subunit
MNRRTLLTRIVQGFSVTGLGFFLYPFVRSFLPDPNDTFSIEVDVSQLKPGHSKTVPWQGRHLYVIRRHLKRDALLVAENEDLKDPLSAFSTQPEFAENAWRSRQPDLLIVYKNCTHLGCEVSLQLTEEELGFECPCHRSEFDQAGRVSKTSIASFNLEVPNYKYLSRNTIKLLKG